jgi:hypothetical protein
MRSYVVLGAFSLGLTLALACEQSSNPKDEASPLDTGKKETAPISVSPREPPAAAKPAAGPVTIDLVATGVEPRNDDNPKTKLGLSVREPGKPEQQIELLTVTGDCERLVGKDADAGALVTLRCWFAGSGDTVSVYQDGDALVVRHQESDEAAEAPLPVKELERVPLPAGARAVTP